MTNEPTVEERLERELRNAASGVLASAGLLDGVQRRRRVLRRRRLAARASAVVAVVAVLSGVGLALRPGSDADDVLITADSDDAVEQAEGIDTAPQAAAEPEQTVVVEVELFDNSIERSAPWELAGSIPYGTDSSRTVGLSVGGDEGAEAFWGPDSVAAVDASSWWVVDTGYARVALFDAGELVHEVQLDPSEAIQFGSVLADGRFIAQGRSGWFVFDRNSPVAVPIDSDAEVDLPNVRLSPFVDDDGFVRIENRCNDVEQEFRLEAIRPAGVDETALFLAGAEAWCSSASGEVAVLWYGYFEGTETQFATFVLLDRSGAVEAIEPAGPLFGEHDSGTPAMLGLLPETGEAFLGLNGESGLELWVRDPPSITDDTASADTPVSVGVPDAGWFGLAISRSVGTEPRLEFVDLASLEVVGTIAAPTSSTCSTDLLAVDDGVYLGTAASGDSSEAVVARWGAAAFEPGSVAPPGEWPWERNFTSTFEVVRATDADNLTLEVATPEGASQIEILGTEGDVGAAVIAHERGIALLRVEPFEPACDHGVVFVLDLVAGEQLACIVGVAADLTAADAPPVVGPRFDLSIDYAACRSQAPPG